MSLKDTFKNLKTLLQEVTADLEKSESGNKAASQRVRTGTIKLEKIAKLYRKESIKSEKSGSVKKPKSKMAKGSKGTSKSTSSSKIKSVSKPVVTKTESKSSKATSKPSVSKANTSKAKPERNKKPTAKILKKK